MATEDGGQAYPVYGTGVHVKGMTLRDWFAGQALMGLIASNDEAAGDRITDLPSYAYSIADEMLQARKAGE